MTEEKKEQTVIQKLCAPLDKADVELRIGTTSAKGFSLLAYKTARTDVKRLNDVCGLNWSNKYFYDGKDILSCAISIKHHDEWVSRTDVGTESNTEKEKGSYSDAFKRAGFKWGIGIELYQSPFIWISWEMELNSKSQKHQPKAFYSSSLDIQEYQVIEGVPYFKIAYDKKVIFDNLPAQDKKENKEPVKKRGETTANKKKYEEYLACLGKVESKELWLQVKPKKDLWVIWAKDNYGEDYSEQLNDKFLTLAERFEPAQPIPEPVGVGLDDSLPDFLK